LIDAFSHHVHVAPNVSIAFGDLLIAIAVGVVAVVAIRLALGIARDQNRSAGGARTLPQRTDADALYARSVRAAQEGDFGEAASLLFRAALAALDLRGVLHDDPSRTVNETRAAVRVHAPQCVSSFDTIARAFTAAFYADEPISPEQWDAARKAFAQLTMQVRADAA
jgi:hypothetical protein